MWQRDAERLHSAQRRGKRLDVVGAYRINREEGIKMASQKKASQVVSEVRPSISVGAEEKQNPRLLDALTR